MAAVNRRPWSDRHASADLEDIDTVHRWRRDRRVDGPVTRARYGAGMAKPAVIAKITAQDGKRDELVAVFRKMIDYVSSSETGTEVYALNTDDGDVNVLWFYELYSDSEALAQHGTSDMMKSVGRELKDLLAGRPEIIRLSPVAAKGLNL